MQVFPVFLPHRGCSHRCRFCNQEWTTGHSTGQDLDTLELRLERMVPRNGRGEVAFYGGTFTLQPRADQERILHLAQRFVREGRIAGIRVSTRPDGLETDQVDLLRSSGVTTVEVGVQTFDDDVLEKSDRGYRASIIAPAVDRLQGQGIQVGLQLMPGLPGGDREEALSSLQRALNLGPDFLRIYPAVVLAGTALASDYRQGRFQPWSLDEAVDVCADMLVVCHASNVPVIRLGLQHGPQFEGDALVAGPHHQAFGQLVRARLWGRGLHLALKAHEAAAAFEVHPSDLSDALGHRRSNLNDLRQIVPTVTIAASRSVPRGCFRFGNEIISIDTF